MPTKKSIYDRMLQKWFPKQHIRVMMSRLEREFKEKREAEKSPDDRWEIEDSYNFTLSVLSDQLTSIEDRALVKKAALMDLSLHDIPIPETNPALLNLVWVRSHRG